MAQIRQVLMLVITGVFLSVGVGLLQQNIGLAEFNQTLASVTVSRPSAPSDRPHSPTHSPTQNSAETYFFTLTLPEYPQQKFARLSWTEQPQQQGPSAIQWNLAETTAFWGTPDAKGNAITIADTWVDETGTIWVEMNPAIAPQSTITVVFKASDSTQQEGYGETLEYGIAAYPDTTNAIAVFVGTARLAL